MAETPDYYKIAASIWKTFETWEIPVHSFLAAADGDVLWQAYRPPYQEDTLHRMFSITKSYCSLAIGSLAATGRLQLDDRIIRFFPEYVPSKTPLHPDLAGMTIRHMLTMQTCHSGTTYKQHADMNWVESFFTTPPTHPSGQIFLYDTSASHTLAALVKKLTGMGVLDYLRSCFLDRIGFSQEAYIIADPFGGEMGGSGLMARPKDLLLTAQYLQQQIHHGTDGFADYLRAAVSLQVHTLHYGQTIDEQQGYGYQFWRIRNGFAMYGLGGQYVLFYPEQMLIFVITADAQNIKGGTQKILDTVYSSLAPYHPQLFGVMNGAGHSGSYPAAFSASWAGDYRLLPNQGGFTDLTVSLTADRGNLILRQGETIFELPFGWNQMLITAVIAKYHQPIASAGRLLDRQTLLVHTQLAGESVGSLTFMMRFRPEGVTLWMKKVEETSFNEFCGFAEGTRKTPT